MKPEITVVYVLGEGEAWSTSANGAWSLEPYRVIGQSHCVGVREIDGALCAVFRRESDGSYRAVPVASLCGTLCRHGINER